MNTIFLIIIQLLHSIGAIVLFGFLIAWCNACFYRSIGASSRLVCYITGAVGTPIHEIGHAFFCVVFRHKITEMKLFQIDTRSDALGYVKHSYNPKSFYQCVGNFFIGVGPILFGSAVLLLLMRLMVPELFDVLRVTLRRFSDASAQGGVESVLQCLKALGGLLGDFFHPRNFGNLWWWGYLVVGSLIALHMDLSKPDIEGAKSGAVLFAVVVLVVNVIFALLGDGAQAGFHRGFISVCLSITGVLCLSLLFSLVFLLAAVVARQLRRR